jgi:TPR repeat protein
MKIKTVLLCLLWVIAYGAEDETISLSDHAYARIFVEDNLTKKVMSYDNKAKLHVRMKKTCVSILAVLQHYIDNAKKFDKHVEETTFAIGDTKIKSIKNYIEYIETTDFIDHAFVRSLVGQCYRWGLGVQKDFDKAFNYFKTTFDECKVNGKVASNLSSSDPQGLVELGYRLAGLWLSDCYAHGLGCLSNCNQAVSIHTFMYGHLKNLTFDPTYVAEYNTLHLYFGNLAFCNFYHNCENSQVLDESLSRVVNLRSIVGDKVFGTKTNLTLALNPEKVLVLEAKTNKNPKDVGALMDLGMYYCLSSKQNRNFVKGFDYFKKAAKLGSVVAQTNVGFCYQYGKGVDKNLSKAFKWYTKSARQGCFLAKNQLGYYYRHGKHCVTPSAKEDYLFFLRMGTEMNDCMAQYTLGRYLFFGDNNHLKSRKLMRKAASQGHTDACTVIESTYMNDFVKVGSLDDEEKLLDFINKAAYLGSFGHGRSQTNIGLLHQYGVYTPVNKDRAMKIYEEARENGCPRACLQLGRCYEKTEPKKAFQLYKEAFFKGDGVANFYLGRCYEIGIGVKPSKLKAAGCYDFMVRQFKHHASKEAIMKLRQNLPKNRKNLPRWNQIKKYKCNEGFLIFSDVCEAYQNKNKESLEAEPLKKRTPSPSKLSEMRQHVANRKIHQKQADFASEKRYRDLINDICQSVKGIDKKKQSYPGAYGVIRGLSNKFPKREKGRVLRYQDLPTYLSGCMACLQKMTIDQALNKQDKKTLNRLDCIAATLRKALNNMAILKALSDQDCCDFWTYFDGNDDSGFCENDPGAVNQEKVKTHGVNQRYCCKVTDDIQKLRAVDKLSVNDFEYPYQYYAHYKIACDDCRQAFRDYQENASELDEHIEDGLSCVVSHGLLAAGDKSLCLIYQCGSREVKLNEEDEKNEQDLSLCIKCASKTVRDELDCILSADHLAPEEKKLGYLLDDICKNGVGGIQGYGLKSLTNGICKNAIDTRTGNEVVLLSARLTQKHRFVFADLGDQTILVFRVHGHYGSV